MPSFVGVPFCLGCLLAISEWLTDLRLPISSAGSAFEAHHHSRQPFAHLARRPHGRSQGPDVHGPVQRYAGIPPSMALGHRHHTPRPRHHNAQHLTTTDQREAPRGGTRPRNGSPLDHEWARPKMSWAWLVRHRHRALGTPPQGTRAIAPFSLSTCSASQSNSARSKFPSSHTSPMVISVGQHRPPGIPLFQRSLLAR